MRYAVLCALLAACAGCETRTYKELRLRHEALRIEHERVLEQMNQVWQQSLKARFPLIKPIEADRPIELGLQYIQSVKLAPDPHVAQQWQVELTHLARQENVHPNYVLYLFDRRGLNIGRLRVDPKKWAVKNVRLEQGRPSTYSGEIPLDFPETPRYFWIRLLE